MPQVVIENPVINSPFSEPTRHYRFSDEGITNEIVASRRTSQYFIPIARPKKKGQMRFETEWTADRAAELAGCVHARQGPGLRPLAVGAGGRRRCACSRLPGGRGLASRTIARSEHG